MSKYAIFSDVHANLPAMAAVKASIESGDFDAVYCLGDLGGYASQPDEVQDLITQMGCPTVLGNYDEGVGFERESCGCHYIKPFDIEMSDVSFFWTREHTSPEHKAWLRNLPREIRFEVVGFRVLLCHGSPRDTTEYLFENRSDGYLKQFTSGGKADANADVIVFGHTHVPFHRVVDGVHFINTGSVGRPKDGNPRAGYCVLTIDEDGVRTEQIRVEYDVESACESLVTAGLPKYFADYLRTGGQVPAPTNEEAKHG
jgi:putative phosphoesterase